ncbi:Inositol Hexakisphosphate And Diphosphoinositol-Pentakisphosphate Kinase 1 [Manis pentadactyla]|nr:Inositol Hexakisphosphate And Diphosphoinositol-Pentakisphosphate Kinase 1 [Manis pentadactyla]
MVKCTVLNGCAGACGEAAESGETSIKSELHRGSQRSVPFAPSPGAGQQQAPHPHFGILSPRVGSGTDPTP